MQQARNLALTPGERFEDIRFLIRDRGPDFTASSGAVVTKAPPVPGSCVPLSRRCA